jgi:hypothetical protein
MMLAAPATRRKPTTVALFAVFSALLVAACGKSSPPPIDTTEVSGDGGNAGQNGKTCSPGKHDACACPAGVGVQVCSSDGSGFSACQCQGGAGGQAGTTGGPDTPFGQGGASAAGGANSGCHSLAGGASQGSGMACAGSGGAGDAGAEGVSGAGQGGALPVGSKCGDPAGGEAGVGGMSQCVLATLDPCGQQQNIILTDGNLVARTTTFNDSVRATAGHDHGKWYWEVTHVTSGKDSFSGAGFGSLWTSLEIGPGDNDGCQLHPNGSMVCDTALSQVASYAEGDTVGLAMDLDQGLVYLRLASG